MFAPVFPMILSTRFCTVVPSVNKKLLAEKFEYFPSAPSNTFFLIYLIKYYMTKRSFEIKQLCMHVLSVTMLKQCITTK